MTGIPKEEAIKYFEDMKKGIFLFNGNWLFDMAIEALRQEPKWIPVEERLPEKEGRYLVWAEFYYIPDHVDEPNTYELDTVASYIGGKWYGVDFKRIIAWMPLPKPYEQQESET